MVCFICGLNIVDAPVGTLFLILMDGRECCEDCYKQLVSACDYEAY
jgi:hypothetical protein